MEWEPYSCGELSLNGNRVKELFISITLTVFPQY